jgi:hypothetical protein
VLDEAGLAGGVRGVFDEHATVRERGAISARGMSRDATVPWVRR